MANSKKNNYKPPSELDEYFSDDSPEQKRKNARRRERAKKRGLAKVPQRKGGTAAPKLYKTPSKEAIAKGQKEVLDDQALRDFAMDRMTTEEFISDRDIRAEWDVGKDGKRGQYRGADIPRRSAKKSEEQARKNPDPGAHRGQSVGPHYERAKSRKAGGKVELGPKMARKKAYNSGGQVKLGLKPTNKTTVTAKGMGAAKRGGNFKV